MLEAGAFVQPLICSTSSFGYSFVWLVDIFYYIVDLVELIKYIYRFT